jgi:hypothetical protein
MSNHRYNRLFNAVILGIFILFAGTTAHAQLSGDYFIPQGAHAAGFESLEEAFNAINNDGANAPVTFYITDDLDESGYLVLTRALTENAYLTVKPAPDSSPTVTLKGNPAGHITAGAGIGIEHAAWIIFDGSNEPDGESRDLTLALDDRVDGTLGIQRGFHIFGSSNNITIKNINLIITHEFDDTPSKPGRVPDGIRIIRQDEVIAPSNVRIENSQIGDIDKMFTNGVLMWGQTEQLTTENIQILNNDIYAGYRGITGFWNTNDTYSNNRIHLTGNAISSWYAGIYTPGLIGGTISGNEILLYGAANTAAAQISGVLFNTTRGMINVYNNMISTVDDAFLVVDDVNTHKLFGFLSHRTGHESSTYNIYHNTVLLGDVGQNGRSAPVGWDEDVTQANSVYNIKNNILVNEANHSSAYALHWNVTQTDNGEINSDHNNLYAPDANVGFWVDEATTSISDWQFASDQDNNSISTAVAFVSNNNLRLAEENTDLITANAIPLVWYDIDDKERDPSGVYMGAHEFDPDVSVPPTETIAHGYWLGQNYPNPFNPSTNIRFNLPVDGQVKIEVYTVMGQLVDTIVNEYRTAGEHIVTFDARSLSSGVYIYRITAGEYAESKRMMFLK